MDEIFATLPVVPKELINASFDEVRYVEELLKREPLSVEYIEHLLQANSEQMQKIDSQIENLVMQVRPPPTEVAEISSLFAEAHMLTTAIREVESLVTKHVSEMRRINTARLELDAIQFVLACALAFKKLSVEQLEDLAYLAMLRPNVAFLEQNDVEISAELARMAAKTDEARQIELPSHLEGAFEFWSTAARKNLILLALNENCGFYKDITQKIVQEGFWELADAQPLSRQFVRKLDSFMQLHGEYMRDFESRSVDAVAAGRTRYKELLSRYSEPVNEKMCFSAKEIIANNRLFNEFVQFFAGRISQKLARQLENCSIQQTIELLELSKAIEVSLQSGGIKSGQLQSLFSCKEEEIAAHLFQEAACAIEECLESLQPDDLRNAKKTQLEQFFNVDVHQKLQSCDFTRFFELLPGRTRPFEKMQDISNELVNMFAAFMERELDFGAFVPLKLTKRSDFADFTRLAKGIVQPYYELKAFSTGNVVPVDFSPELNVIPYITSVEKAIRLSTHILEKMREILANHNYQVEFDMQRLFQAQDNAELAVCALISGRLCYAVSSAEAVSQVAAAREVCRREFEQLFEAHEQFYDEFEMDSLRILARESFISAAAVCGCKLIERGEIFDAFLDSIKDIEAELSEEPPDERLETLLTLRRRVLSGELLSRREFVAAVGEEGVEWWSDIIE